jgi:hypothetical protein
LRSTSGAYGDFPDYYYKSGNLFGSYLLGKTAPISRDTRREVEALGGGYPVVRPGPKPAPLKGKTTPHEALMNYVRASVTPAGANRIIAALAQHRGVALPELSTVDPYELLDKFAIEHLTPRDQLRVRVRLERVARELAADERKRQQRGAKRAKKSGATPRAKSRKGKHGAPLARARAVSDLPKPSTACALCGATLTRLEQTRCRREPKVFMSQAYCTEHADRLKALLSKQG